MLGLPKSTEIRKQLPKTALYTKFQMNSAEKAAIEEEISRITIINEVSAEKLRLEAGAETRSFFVLSIVLKKRDFSEKTIIKISTLIPQKMLLLLEYENEAKLAIYHINLMQTPWSDKEDLNLELKGFDMDAVWENIVAQVGRVEIEEGRTLDQQIEADEEREKLKKEIARLEKKAWAEKQPRKKFELAKKIKELKKQIGE